MVARQQLSRGTAVTVIKVADRALVLGVSDTQISLLADADADLFPEPPPPLPNPALKFLRELR